MDPRHKLYQTLDKLSVDPDTTMSGTETAQASAGGGVVTSGVTMEGIKAKLESGLGATHVEIADLSGMYDFVELCI